MQLEEADLIVISKSDLLSVERRDALIAKTEARFSQARVRMLSAMTGKGVDAWLDEVMSGGSAGTHIAEVDYDVYAAGEAALGWLNAKIALSARDADADWTAFCHALVERLRREFHKVNAAVGHVKAALTAAAGTCLVNLTHTDGDASLRGDAGRSDHAELILNARVEMDPEALERMVRLALQETARDALTTEVRDLRCFRPAPPNPTHRHNKVV